MAAWLGIKSPMPHCKAFTREVADGVLVVLVGMEPAGEGGKLLWHMSISHRHKALLKPDGTALLTRVPNWEEIKEARYKFVPDKHYMAMILPPMAEYVNLHETTMHLHEIEN